MAAHRSDRAPSPPRVRSGRSTKTWGISCTSSLAARCIPVNLGERASSHQVCDPHHCDHVTVIERLLFCALRASPDMVLFRRKGPAILHEPKLSFSDVTDHGILHRVIGGLRPRLHDD